MAQVFLPTIFARWKGLKVVDLCQEALSLVDNRWEPAPVTQLQPTRPSSAHLSWSTASLAAFLAPSEHQPPPPG